MIYSPKNQHTLKMIELNYTLNSSSDDSHFFSENYNEGTDFNKDINVESLYSGEMTIENQNTIDFTPFLINKTRTIFIQIRLK